MKNIFRNLKGFIVVVNKSISYLLFRFYRIEELIQKADKTMRAARTERLEQWEQFMIPCLRKNSCGKDRALDKESFICEFVEFNLITNQRHNKECMSIFLDKVKVNGVQDTGLTPFREFMPRSAPLIDFLSIKLHFGVGWKYPSANTIHGIQAYRGLSYQRLEDVEIKEIIQDLPVCVGLGVKGDVQEIEQFYSKVSSINLEMAGFIDLRALTLVVGYQMNARGITPMGVLVLGAILNKCVRPQTLPGGYLKLDPESIGLEQLLGDARRSGDRSEIVSWKG